jgi:hypothetical protein
LDIGAPERRLNLVNQQLKQLECKFRPINIAPESIPQIECTGHQQAALVGALRSRCLMYPTQTVRGTAAAVVGTTRSKKSC